MYVDNIFNHIITSIYRCCLFQILANMTLEFIQTKRGSDCLVVASNRFRKSRESSKAISWRCCNTGCKSICKTDLNQRVIVEQPTSHDHAPVNDSSLDLERARSAVKRKAAESLEADEKPNKIVCGETMKYASLSSKHVETLTKSYHRAKLLKQPPLPSEVENFQ